MLLLDAIKKSNCDINPNVEGMVPLNLLFPIKNSLKEENFPKKLGIDPVKPFVSIWKVKRVEDSLTKVVGIVPPKRLLATKKSVKADKFPKDEGKFPDKALFSK